jgi:hypothetical protein
MGLTHEAARPAASTASRRRLAGLLFRPIWLPRLLYARLPWIYLLLGSGCLLGALYLPDDSWVLPYLALCGLACLHGGIGISALRRRGRPRDP